MIEKANLRQLTSFVTADGSAIRELAGPAWTSARAQSLAEATVEPGAATAEHYHPRSEELYYFVAGEGRMRLGQAGPDVAAGYCGVIPPGTVHKLFTDGSEPLVLLCCCAPAYSD